jgi:hypothetical protein
MYKQIAENLGSRRPWTALALNAIKIAKIVMLTVLYDCKSWSLT